jgi:two-component system NtrC family sensor kinase
MYDLIHPDEKEASRQWVEAGMPTGIEGGYEHRLMQRDGDHRWFQTNSSVLRGETGDPVELIGIMHDITEIKRVLDDLERANQELRDTQSQLVQSEKMASLGQLVAGVAHEINTPIGAVNSMHDTLVRAVDKLHDLLKSEYAEAFDRDQRLQRAMKAIHDANSVIKNGTERVTTIVRRLRSFARLDEAELKDADVHEGIEDTLTLIHHEIKNRIEIVRDFQPLPRISCFPGQLNQVFLNLLNNARQAISGQGTITIRTRHENGKVIIHFRDSGHGISPDHLRRIFDPGFTTKGVGVGTGLGLSICFQIVQGHRGDIRVESEVGRGTEFIITLPTNLDELLQAEQG